MSYFSNQKVQLHKWTVFQGIEMPSFLCSHISTYAQKFGIC